VLISFSPPFLRDGQIPRSAIPTIPWILGGKDFDTNADLGPARPAVSADFLMGVSCQQQYTVSMRAKHSPITLFKMVHFSSIFVLCNFVQWFNKLSGSSLHDGEYLK
jgi:hypothetical protein